MDFRYVFAALQRDEIFLGRRPEAALASAKKSDAHIVTLSRPEAKERCLPIALAHWLGVDEGDWLAIRVIDDGVLIQGVKL